MRPVLFLLPFADGSALPSCYASSSSPPYSRSGLDATFDMVRDAGLALVHGMGGMLSCHTTLVLGAET